MTQKLLAPLCCIAGLAFADEYSTNWPRFRGPGGSGVSAQADVPLACDVKSGKNIAWIADVPAPGFSSPIVWGDRVFLSGDDKGKGVVMCFDAASGKLLWQKSAPKKSDKNAEAPDQSGLASSTPATDGKRVYAMFANGELDAFNLDGSMAWSKQLGAPKNQYGHATSLTTWQEQVIVQLDQGEADDKLSKISAFDGATGKATWEQAREVGSSWATPIVIEAAGKSQIITLGVPWVISYDAKSGKEIWRAECLDGEVTPSPVFAGGTLFAIHPTTKLQALRVDGSCDVTKTHIDWIAEDGIPDVTSPVSNGELVFLNDSQGTVTCYDAKTGKKQWEHDLGEEFKASPSIVGDKVCLVSYKGTIIVLEAAREFKEVSRSHLNEQVLASPAFAKDRMFIRGTKHLFCIGAKS